MTAGDQPEPVGFDALIEAFTILRRYDNPTRPTHCEHDELWVLVDPDQVAVEDRVRLHNLGFVADDDNTFKSYRFGSA